MIGIEGRLSELAQSHWYKFLHTSNVTGRHRGPKRKLRAGYRAPSRHASHVCLLDVPGLCAPRIVHPRVWYRALSLRCACYAHAYSMSEHHPHPLGYPCAKFRFCRALRYWDSPRRRIAYSINRTQSYSPIFIPPGPKLSLRNQLF